MSQGWRSQPLPPHWDRTCRRILRRDGGVCHVCKGIGATSIDHVIPVCQGGSEDDRNLAAIHERPCHEHKTALEANEAKPKRKREQEPHPGIIGGGGYPPSSAPPGRGA